MARHVPVLCNEVVDALAVAPDAVVVDCTFGRGGHTRALLERMGAGSGGRVLALDRDPDAVRAGLALDDPRLEVVHARFDALAALCAERDLTGRVDAILFDLGVSSPQLEDPARGFSLRHAGPLDMRMDPDDGEPLGAWLARVAESELADIIRRYGEERAARRIARAIVRARPLETTVELASVIERALPRPRSRSPRGAIHPATRTFQALRIHINRELESLEAALPGAVEVLRPGGRLAVISFHSLEDRIVKRFLRAESRTAPPPGARGLPPPSDAAAPRLRLVGRSWRPGADEVDANPRARSAVLRVAEKLPAPDAPAQEGSS